jgi:glutamine amidotransferase PdxT
LGLYDGIIMPGMGFKNIFKASKNTYLRHQLKTFKGSRKNIHFCCAGAVFWPFYAIFKSCGF